MARRTQAIKSWPQEERPREKLALQGPGTLGPSELLAILLRTGDGPRGLTALDLSREIWVAYGEDWERLGQATPAELAAHAGLGPAKAASILSAIEIGRRISRRPLEAVSAFRESRQVFEHFASRFSGLRREVFYCLLLDTRNRYLREEKISEGSLTASLVHPREAFRAAVREAASAVIFAHNHPSGVAEPSRADELLTSSLKQSLALVDVKVLDHFVVGGNSAVSFAESGLL